MTQVGPGRGLPVGCRFSPIQSHPWICSQPSLWEAPNLLLEALALPGGCKVGNTYTQNWIGWKEPHCWGPNKPGRS